MGDLQLTKTVLALVFPAMLIAHTPSAFGVCQLTRPTLTKSVEGACTIRHLATAVHDRTFRFRVNVYAAEIRCGSLRLGDWRQRVQDSADLCSRSSILHPGEVFDIDSGYAVTGQFRRFVSVDESIGSHVGAARPSASVRRRTYDTRTGAEVSLRDVFPRRWKQLRERAWLTFQRQDVNVSYRWDEQAFAVIPMGRGRVLLAFAMPSQAGQLNMTTLDFQVMVRVPPSK